MIVIINGLSYTKVLEIDKYFGCKEWRTKLSSPFDEQDYIVVTLNDNCSLYKEGYNWLAISYNDIVYHLHKKYYSYLTITGEK